MPNSDRYVSRPCLICSMSDLRLLSLVCFWAVRKLEVRIEIRMPMMAMTTSSSINVKPSFLFINLVSQVEVD